MLASFDKLSRMLIQERKRGYKNDTVFGGFEKYVPNWSAEALNEATGAAHQKLVKEVADNLTQYPDISEKDRPNFIHDILVRLNKSGTANSQKKQVEAKKPLPQTVAKIAQPKPVFSVPPPQPHAQTNSTNTKPAARPPRHDGWEDLAHVGMDSSVTRLPGIKEAIAKKLANLNVITVGDFLTLYPRRYDDYSTFKTINQLRYGEVVTLLAQVWETRQRTGRRNTSLVTSVVTDTTGTIEITWFNQPWLVNKLKPDTQIVISGKVDEYLGRLTFQSPEWEILDKKLLHTGRIVPVYPLTKGITIKWLREYIEKAVDYWVNRLPDYLPVEVRDRLGMLPMSEAIRHIHYPDSWEMLELARRRLAFDELLMILLGVLRQRQAWQSQTAQPVHVDSQAVDKILQTLPFTLTKAQQKALNHIISDLQRDIPMSRLVQGDVGSGKTVVALAAMVCTALDGGQTAILAPTEILAEQHYKGMGVLLEQLGQALGHPFSIKLLTGSTPAAERRDLLARLEAGDIDILVGTHAIIQSNVVFKQLRLAVIDEQHRFGVQQRANLRDKGFNPHMLVMTATPIPRTLALTLYGDLDLSVIDEMPPGRQTIQTRWLAPKERERAYSFIQSQVEKGRQAFIICPLVEESEKTEARSAIEEHKRLQTEVFPQLKLGLLHGRMKPDEKEKVMMGFRDQHTDILVSTSVVEVGIDVPNATVMLIEGANRFGLAQLHQFRGRVGRGQHQSYCMLLSDSYTPEAESRLKAVENTSDGFELAEQDLKMRGPGEFFGTRQSGLPDLKLVKLSDTRLLELARAEAQKIFDKDSTLQDPDHQLLVRQLNSFWKHESDLS